MVKRLIKIIKNPYFFSLFAKVFGVVGAFVFTVFQARFLGAEIKGQVATVNSIVSVAYIVFSWGIAQAYPYYKRNSDRDILPVFMRISLLLFAVYMVIAAASILLARMSLKYAAVFLLTPIMTYETIVSSITLIEKPNKRNLTGMFVVVVELVLVALLWMLAEPSFAIGVFIITIKAITHSVIFTFWWRKRIFVRSDPNTIREWLPKLVRFGFFPMLSLLMATLNYRVDVMMLDGRVPDAAIGIYSIGVLIAERIWMIPDALKGVLTSKLAAGKDAAEVSFVIRLCNTGCLLLVLAMIAFGKPFINLVFTKEYEGAYQIILIMLFGVFSMIYYKSIAAYNIVMGKQMLSFVLLTVGVAANIVSNFILIPIWGIYGAGFASVISYTLCGVLFIVFFCRMTHVPFRQMLFIQKSDLQKAKAELKKR